MLHLPFEACVIYYGARFIARNYQAKRHYLEKVGRGVSPSSLEYFQGILCLILLALQMYFKSFTRTMIFILNPCHLTTLGFGLVSVLPVSRVTEVLFPFSIGGCFGAWVGIVWAENGELSQMETFCYYL
jgi:hypothetical protein